jgi:hypothetical protein
MRYHFTSATTFFLSKSVGEDMEKMDPSYFIHGNGNGHNHFGLYYRCCSKKKLSYDTANPLLGI